MTNTPAARSPRSIQLLVLCATLFVAMAGFSVVIPALGDLALTFGASSFEMGAMTAAYAVAQLVSAPGWGALADRVGRKPVIVFGLFGFAVSFLLMGLADTFPTLMAGRVVGGVLSASALPSAQAFAADLARPEERSTVLGKLGASMALGFVLGPLLATVLIPLDIRAPFAFSFVVALLTGLAGAWFLVEPEPDPNAPQQQPLGGVAGFVHHASRSPAAAWFWSAFLVMFGASSVFALLVYYVEQQLHGTAFHASLAFACFGASSALCQGLVLRRLVVRVGDLGAVRVALSVGIVGFATFAAAPNLPVLYGGCALIAAGMALGRPALAALASTETSLGQGMTMGIQSAFDALGRVLGPLSAGLLYAWAPRAPFACAALAYAAGLAYVSRRLAKGR